MLTEINFKVQLIPVDPQELPEDLTGVAKKFGIDPDRAGFAKFEHQLPHTSARVVPRLYRTDENMSYVLGDLFNHVTPNVFPMRIDQAASFVIRYIQQMQEARKHAHTVWIPVRHNQRLTVLRLYFRADGTFELFAYAPDDSSRWAGGDDYLVAYHMLGT